MRFRLFTAAVCTILIFCTSASCFAQDESEAAKNRYAFISYSKKYEGVPYKYGGLDESGMDCSGFIYTVARNSIGMQLPRTVAALHSFAKQIPDQEREPGDIVFFKTMGSKMSHAGIYLGESRFIHAASDGPKTGVIISSLHESYWERTYAGTGQILPPAGINDINKADEAENSAAASASPDPIRKAESLFSLAASFSADWNFGNAQGLSFNMRGFTFGIQGRFDKTPVKPGLSLQLTYDRLMEIVQIPILLSLTLPHRISLYAGPIFTMGNAVQPGSGIPAKAPIFPGIFGISWESTPAGSGRLRLSFVQHLRYTVVQDGMGRPLSAGMSLASGLVFSSGLRVTLML